MQEKISEARSLSEENQAEWIRLMKAWEAENPIDKAGRNPKALGLVGGITLFFAMLVLQKNPDGSISFAPLFAVPFGYLIYFLTNRRFKKWDAKRQAYSSELIQSLLQQSQSQDD